MCRMNKVSTYDELLDLVDDKDIPVGTISRGKFETIYQGPYFIRGAAALIVNSYNQIWVPERIGKKSRPGTWDYSVAEHVGAGETYKEAILRGFSEEVGLKVDSNLVHNFVKLSPTPTSPWFTFVFIYKTDKPPIDYKHEFSAARWMTLAELKRHIEEGQSVRSGLKLLILSIKTLD